MPPIICWPYSANGPENSPTSPSLTVPCANAGAATIAQTAASMHAQDQCLLFISTLLQDFRTDSEWSACGASSDRIRSPCPDESSLTPWAGRDARECETRRRAAANVASGSLFAQMCDYRTIDLVEIGVGNDVGYAERPMDSALACAENHHIGPCGLQPGVPVRCGNSFTRGFLRGNPSQCLRRLPSSTYRSMRWQARISRRVCRQSPQTLRRVA